MSKYHILCYFRVINGQRDPQSKPSLQSLSHPLQGESPGQAGEHTLPPHGCTSLPSSSDQTQCFLSVWSSGSRPAVERRQQNPESNIYVHRFILNHLIFILSLTLLCQTTTFPLNPGHHIQCFTKVIIAFTHFYTVTFLHRIVVPQTYFILSFNFFNRFYQKS